MISCHQIYRNAIKPKETTFKKSESRSLYWLFLWEFKFTSLHWDGVLTSGYQQYANCKYIHLAPARSSQGIETLWAKATWDLGIELIWEVKIFLSFTSPLPPWLITACCQDFALGIESCHGVIWLPEIVVYGRWNVFQLKRWYNSSKGEFAYLLHVHICIHVCIDF